MFGMVEPTIIVMENDSTVAVCAEIVNVPSGGVECDIILPLTFTDGIDAGMCVFVIPASCDFHKYL